MGGNRTLVVLTGCIAAVLALGTLYLTRPVMAPVTFALFLVAVVWPMQRALQAWVPRSAAVLATMLTTLVVVALLATMIAWGFSRAARWVIANGPRLHQLYIEQTSWLDAYGIGLSDILAEHFGVAWLARRGQQVAGAVQGFLTFTGITLLFTLLGLLELEALRSRIAAWPDTQLSATVLRTAAVIARKLQVYMLVRTVMSVLTGVMIYAFARLTGLDLALEWGVIAFALNYIPFIGPLVATIVPTFFAGLQYENWQIGVMVFAGIYTIQFAVGSYLEPRVAGNVLAVSPFLVLFAVFFGALLWGLAGAFIGIPFVIVLLAICEQDPRSRWLSELLSGRPAERA
jgi:predicted PurR-regulated permease PerM